MRLTGLVVGGYHRFAILDDDSIAWNFVSLADELLKVGYKEKIGDSSDKVERAFLIIFFASVSLRRKG
jgi:hypothetical protein